MKRTITKDMLQAAADKGWNQLQTSKHYGFSHSSIRNACERHGVNLQYSKFSRFREDERPVHKPTKAFSASPQAVEKALANMLREKLEAIRK